ncbi:MAG: DUF6599 family protein [Anaerolineae bacterium]
MWSYRGVPRLCVLLIWIVATLLGGCGVDETPSNLASDDPPDLAVAFPQAEQVPGWSPAGDVETYSEETLYNLVNGQADAFFAYNFRQVAVQTYENAGGASLRVEIWELREPADAYGLFTRNIAGDPTDVGNDGDVDPGRRLAFWQSRYFVQVRASEPIPEDEILAFGAAMTASLPPGGEQPALVDRLPAAHRVPRSIVFFRREISIQDEVWLGDENVLGLSGTSAGALAAYELPGSPVLLAIQYATPEEAASAASRLLEAEITPPTAVEARGAMLGAVFGQTSPEVAEELLGNLFE